MAAAAELYFGKIPADLTIAECAVLAGIPKSPVAYSPIRNPKRNAERKALVLSKMAELGFITPLQYEDAKNEDFNLKSLSEQETKSSLFYGLCQRPIIRKNMVRIYFTTVG